MSFLISFILTIVVMFSVLPIFLGLLKLLGIFAIVTERSARVYVMFGKVLGTLEEPGFYFLPAKLGLNALLVNWLGKCYVLDLRLDQEYRRSEAVNSEEGAPMGIGIWYEMFITDPIAYLFKNTDPRGSLRASVSNATVRCLSNMPLAEAQAKWVAEILSGQSGLPTRDKMLAEIQRHRAEIAARYTQSVRHTIQVDFFPYQRLLAKISRRGRRWAKRPL